MPELLVRIKKNRDGSAALTCVRADGSVTWQRQTGHSGSFFPIHDLTHYAVETTLGVRQGFFGLLAEGWDISDTGGKGTRGPLPAEALAVEMVVGFLDAERAGGGEWSAAEFAEIIALHAAARGTPPAERPPADMITDAHLAAVRSAMRALFARWMDVEPGDTLELPFDRPGPRAPRAPQSQHATGRGVAGARAL